MKNRVVSAIVHCSDCDWEEQDYRIAVKSAHAHHRRTGHQVRVCQERSWIIGERKEGTI
jgi:hypothetical protein